MGEYRSFFVLILILFQSLTSTQVWAKSAIFDKVNQPPQTDLKICQSRYNRLTQNGDLRILLAYGYSDVTSPMVLGTWTHDEYEAQYIADLLTQPCQSPYLYICGFTILNKTSHIYKLQKNAMIGLRQIPVYIDIIYSSVSDRDWENRTTYKSEQLQQSLLTEQIFLSSFSDHDIVFYSGHSRDGGGPDFHMPRLQSGGHVAYDWYRQNRPGLRKMLNALKKPIRAQVLGLFSCASRAHFGAALHRTPNSLSLFLSDQVSEAEFLNADLMAALNGLLGSRCGDDINHTLLRVSPQKPVRFYNF